jgi:hypothetical protein
MQISRTPTVDREIAAQDTAVAARIASGELSREAIYGKPYSAAVARDPIGEMADFMLETGTGTMDDLALRFPSRLLTPENIQAARDRANRVWIKHAA